MKKILSLAICLTLNVSSIAYAENNSMDKYKDISNKIIESYNIKDYKNFTQFFNEKLSKSLPEDKAKEFIEAFKGQFGNIKEVGELQILSENAILYPLTFDRGKFNLMLTFDKEDKISEIFFQPINKYPKITEKTTIDQIANPYIAEKINMGLVIGIVKANGQVQEFYYGKTAENKEKPNAETIFEIGSLTKVFTTTALAKMVIDKKVSLNDDIDKYVQAPNYNGTKIKLINLANHTSGLPRIPTDLLTETTDPMNPYADYSRNNMYDYLKNYKLTQKPGTNYDYSNLGTGLLGDILATNQKKDYENFIQDTILKPLAMKNTTTNLSRFQIKNSATGHDTGAPVIMWDFESMGAAGALKSTIKDMMIFIKANMELKNPELKEAMKLAQKSTYKGAGSDVGLGWNISQINKNNVIWHNGGTGGFRSFLGFIKDKNVGVVVLSNSTSDVDDIGVLTLEKLSLEK